MVGPFKELLDEGLGIKTSISKFLGNWPRDDADLPLYWADTNSDHQQLASDLTIQLRQWFNSINQIVMPLILHDRAFLYYTLRQVEAAVRKHQYRRPYSDQPSAGARLPSDPEPAIGSRRSDVDIETRLEIAERDASEAMDTAFDLIKSVPSPRPQLLPSTVFGASAPVSPPAFQPNTAFILMWLDRTKPELEDVSNIIKSVCRAFGIRAFRADDLEHPDVITDVVLQYIRTAEFLIAV